LLTLFARRKYNDQLKEDELGRVCSTHGEKRGMAHFGGKAGKKKTIRKT
jgi:hypothetical protein